MTEPLVKQGAVSEVEVLRLRRQVIELRGTIQDKRNAFRAEARGELATKEAELAGLKQVITARAATPTTSRTRSRACCSSRTGWRASA